MSDFPVHFSRKVGLSPLLTFLVLMPAAIINYLDMPITGTPGTLEYIRSQRLELNSYETMAFIFVTIGFILILPIFRVTLTINEQGITKTFTSRVHFYPWSDLVDIVVSDKGGGSWSRRRHSFYQTRGNWTSKTSRYLSWNVPSQ